MIRNKTVMKANGPVSYYSADGHTMRRDYGRRSDGFQFSGEWVLRDEMGIYVDHDGNRHDLAERNLIVLS